jgi:HK97 family phage major capsid protein
MTATTASFAPLLTPAQVHDLVLRPLIENSLAGQILSPVTVGTHSYRIPIITEFPNASWVLEGQEVPVSDAATEDLEVVPNKLVGLTSATRESLADSNNAVLDGIGQGLVFDLQCKVDAALFASSGTTVNGPNGIAGLSGISAVDAGTEYENVDAFGDSIYLSAGHNGVISNFVTHPDTAMKLSKIKQYGATGSNVPLLQPDPARPSGRQILGVPLQTSPAVDVTNNVVWAIPKKLCYFVIREKAEVETDDSVYFTSQRTAISATIRAAFAFPAPAAVVRIATSTA